MCVSQRKIFNVRALPNFDVFRVYSFIKSENLCAPHVKALPTRFWRVIHVKTVQNRINLCALYGKAACIRTTCITYAKVAPDIFYNV